MDIKKSILTEETVKTWLQEIKDPEIPVISLIDLGVITDILISDQNAVHVKMTPTFAGCPAMAYMKKEVEETLKKNNIIEYTVTVSFEKQWNSNMISDKGRKAIKQFGLAPPPEHNLIIDLDIIEKANCPYCNSENTTMRSPFGPTLCRSLHYCNNCKQGFEQFKPI